MDQMGKTDRFFDLAVLFEALTQGLVSGVPC